MSRPQDPGAFDEDPRTVRRMTGDAPACFRDFMGYHGISRAVKEMGGIAATKLHRTPHSALVRLKKPFREPNGLAARPTAEATGEPKRAAPPTFRSTAPQYASWPVSRVLYGGPRGPRDGHSSATPVAGRLKQPTRTAGLETCRGSRPAPSLFGFAPGGVYHAGPVAGPAVGSYPTLSPLPRRQCTGEAVCFLWHFPWGRPRRPLAGTVFPWSPDFPLRRPFDHCRSGRPAD